MIVVDNITIEEFRGIRSLTLSPGGKNFGICGDNGTGKSGVVDALEFALTGNVSRLAGQGTAGIALKKHAPHVDSRDFPEKAKVTVDLRVPSLKLDVQISRSVSDPDHLVVSPDTDAARAILDEFARHPEFVLSRREIIRFVLAPAGERAKEVQTLLRLDDVERARERFNRIANSSEKVLAPLRREKQEARDALVSAMDITEVRAKEVLEAANRRRDILGIEPMTALSATTSLKQGVKDAKELSQPAVLKQQSAADVQRLKDGIQLLDTVEMRAARTGALGLLRKLDSDPELRRHSQREQLLSVALELVEGEACPVCDTPWDLDELRERVRQKLQKLTEASKLRDEVIGLLDPVRQRVLATTSQAKLVADVARRMKLDDEAKIVGQYETSMAGFGSALCDVRQFSAIITDLESLMKSSENVLHAIRSVEEAIGNLPEPSEQDEAREYLTIAQERLDAYRGISKRLKARERQAELARRVSDTYSDAMKNALVDVYNSVESEFSKFYRFVNREDEPGFEGRLVPKSGKLDFDVDFFGRGKFPPGAYHSEGHQDGMGLCLYLALMKHLLGPGFTLAVLDDVLMSVDRGHRREVCSLLKREFPDTQFVLTTHDDVWLRHMKTEGLITSQSSVQFRNWSVDLGPAAWDDKEVWDEIEAELKKGDVADASLLLRRYLEYFGQQMSHKLRAKVEFRDDARYELGELLPAVIGRLRDLYKKGKSAASSWGQSEVGVSLAKAEKALTEVSDQAQRVGWSINPTVHYNEWANLQVKEFEPVVSAQRQMVEAFTCRSCGCFMYVVPRRGGLEALRCDCGATNFNLKKK